MANPEHVLAVRYGYDAIKSWFKKNQGQRLDLSGADLTGIDLGSSILNGCNLSEADLTKASLVATDLIGANLRGTKFYVTDMVETDLMQADLTDASFGNTRILDCDLSSCYGLETIKHQSASHISTGTLMRTISGVGGNLNAEMHTFFVRAGVPDSLLEYLPSLFLSDPLQFYTCFISYGAEDAAFAARLYDDLTKARIRCWKFDESAVVGRSLWGNIDQAIHVYDKVIVICSENSLRRPAVQDEIERALQKEEQLRWKKRDLPMVDDDVLFPVRLDEYIFDSWQHERKPNVVKKVVGDFRDWRANRSKYQRELQRLIKALNPQSWPLKP